MNSNLRADLARDYDDPDRPNEREVVTQAVQAYRSRPHVRDGHVTERELAAPSERELDDEPALKR